MPLQNRVTPFGEVVATPHRGTLMGNRGLLHDERRRVRRDFADRRWLACELEFRDVRRAVMSPGRYTELFFLDEATALAAGHRPCADCRPFEFRMFRCLWAVAHGESAPPSADATDRDLHAQRLDANGGKRTFAARLGELPGGVMVADAAGRALLWVGGRVLPWDFVGYGEPEAPGDGEYRVLTPASTVGVIRGGYPVGIHPSAVTPSSPPTDPRTPPGAAPGRRAS